MNLFQKSCPQNLDEWLEIATRKLAQPAKNRIRSDIESHYDEAVAGRLENDSPGGVAQVAGLGNAKHDLITVLRCRKAHLAALSELGNAKAAARRFRKEHLTGPEFQMIANLLRKSGRFGLLRFAALLGVSCLAGLSVSVLPIWLAGLPVLVVPIVLTAVLGKVSRHDNLNLHWLILRESAMNFSLGVVLSALMLTSYHLHFWDAVPMAHIKFAFIWLVMRVWSAFGMIAFVMCSLSAFWHGIAFFQLRNKLGKVAEDWMMEAL